jgi:amidase
MSVVSDDQLLFAGPGALARMVRAREVSPRELVELCLRVIEALNPRLNAFRAVMADEALAAAGALEDLDAPLAGVPIAVKDEIPVAGQLTTRGSRSYGAPATADAEPIRRLRAAGAIPIGITNTPELLIFPWTATDANGVTRNPWDLTRSPGGSSGGSAAAVASGMVPCATASDGGGSIRIPASCCGLVGMKPTRGRVSSLPGVAGWLGLSVRGALARTVRDSALLLDAMHGTLEGESYTAPPFTGSYADAAERPPGRLRIAASKKKPPGVLATLSDDQRRAWESTCRLLSDLGHEVVERDPAYGDVGVEFMQTWVRGIYEESLTVPDRSQLERSTRQMAAAGRYLVPDRRRARLLAKRGETVSRITALWNEVDVVLTPGLATTALPAEGGYDRSAPIAFNRSARLSPWTSPFNVTGQPAVSLPAGFGADGLPLSVQLVGRLGAEDLLYSLAGEIERARPWADYRPPIATSADPTAEPATAGETTGARQTP